MSLSKLVSLVGLVGLCSFSVAACAANTDATEDVGESQDQELSSAKIHACDTDDDCVAVDRGGCCSNGWLEAVNKHHTKAYENASKCTANPRPMCPMYMVHDTRVPECNAKSGKKQCEMVAIEDIACGGHTPNPHACPDGYACEGKSLAVDGPGKCEKAPEPKDCRADGCGAGKYCSFCWGNYACIPNGAMC
jgi:hypothetical protein